jgi:high-affinity K+ transport system ATPase subunit B
LLEAGSYRKFQHHHDAGRAVEAAGDTRTVLLDNTGTITIDNQQATDRVP